MSVAETNRANLMNPYWLRAVRISAFCIFLVIFVAMALMYGSLLIHYVSDHVERYIVRHWFGVGVGGMIGA